MESISLNGNWNLYYFSQLDNCIDNPEDLTASGFKPVQAVVPGNVELDLVNAGILPEDLFWGENIRMLEKYELYEWWYEREFSIPEALKGKTLELIFYGVDCMACYWLNGEKIGESSNMFIEHRFDISGIVLFGAVNKLTIQLKSPVIEAAKKEYTSVMEAFPTNWEQLWIRKAPHSFGWDIMPRVLSAGLWRSVELLVHEANEINDLYFCTIEADRHRATLEVNYQVKIDLHLLNKCYININGWCGKSKFEARQRVRFTAGKITINIDSPALWWPRGYGSPYLYDITSELIYEGQILDSRQDRFGIRKVELLRSEVTSTDRPGNFLFKINNEPILCKGANWVPADVFHSRDAGKYDGILEFFCDLNCNIIRCWGGNVYEDHLFFDICDERGLMIWQDFAMACGIYPQSDEFFCEIEKEAVSVIKKLRNHASLILWSGDNECDFTLGKKWLDCSDNMITRNILPRAVNRHDPYRPYLESSPYYSPEVSERRDTGLMPEDHVWGPRDYYKSRFYTENRAHFISETGYHGCPNLSSMKKFLDEDKLWPWEDNSQWLVHCTDCTGEDALFAYRLKLMADQIEELFGFRPDNLEEFIIASQISQAEALKFFIERTRMKKWYTTGIIWWNVMDGWPQFSDSIVDYYSGRKLAYYYIKRVQQPFCIMVDEPDNWHVKVIAGNDSNENLIGSYRIWDADTEETVLEGVFSTRANCNCELGQIRISWSHKRLFLIEWIIDGEKYGNHYMLGFPPISLEQYKTWLEKIARLQANFDADLIGK